MRRKVGSWTRNNFLTHSGMWWVDGERWWTFRTQTVHTVEKVTRTIVNIRYFPTNQRRTW